MSEVSTACGKILQRWLMASYAYYCRDESLMSDTQYDADAKLLQKYWDQFDHQHKHLVTFEDLEAGSLFKLRQSDYPLMVINAAEYWITQKATA